VQRDILDDLGYLFLGSRLKRLAERMQADAAKVIAHAGLPIQPAQFPLLAAIDRYGPMSVGDAVDALRVSQPAVTRSLTSLVGLGLLETTRTAKDQRQKTIALTAKGRAVMKKAHRVIWPSVGAAATELCKGLTGDLLTQIGAVEARLDQRSLETRVHHRAPVEILDFTDDLAPDFHAINAEWITSMFVLETADREVLENPRARILDRGGAILFAATKQHGVVGTCALYRTAPGEFELTKMGVREIARGLKVGERLLEAAIERARSMRAKKLYLLTNSKCRPAIHLYEKAGFVHDADVMQTYGARYARCDVAMLYPPARLEESASPTSSHRR
jgi:DNA-binding MarR family transcriptional regulator/GNAT superfamily N-acetyltransferase